VRVWCVLVVALVTSRAQNQPIFRSGAEVVRLDVSVMRGGQPIRGLKARDFVVTDNGMPQTVETVELEQGAVDVFMVLDTSRSMKGQKLQDLSKAARSVVESLRQDDKAAVLSFSHLINVRTPLVADRVRLMSALDSLRADGATALRDALFVAVRQRPSADSRPLLLLFSDGADTVSWLTETEAIESVRRAGMTVHIVALNAANRTEQPPRLDGIYGELPSPVETQRAFLERVADVSGGRTWSGSSHDLNTAFTRALDEMRSRYVVSFYPTGSGRTGWHELKVRLSVAHGDVRTRAGYFVAGEGH
jgi:Ca-activated chloride channel family protein